MSSYQWVWTDAGLANAQANGVSPAEAVEAVSGEHGPQSWDWLGEELVLVGGLTAAGSVIVVQAARLDRLSPVLRIKRVRRLPAERFNEWWRRAR